MIVRIPLFGLLLAAATMSEAPAQLDRAERRGRQLGFLAPEFLLNAVRECRVCIRVADAQTPHELTHGRLFVLRRRFGDAV